jgi:hypothetical protein
MDTPNHVTSTVLNLKEIQIIIVQQGLNVKT